MSEPIRVALVEPIPALALVFQRAISDAACSLWADGDANQPDLVVLGLDSPDPAWAITVERWLAKGIPVIASAIRPEAFSLVNEYPEAVQALDRPFTPLQLKGALAISADLIRASAVVMGSATEEELTAVDDALPDAFEAIELELDGVELDGVELDEVELDEVELDGVELDGVELRAADPRTSVSGDVEVVVAPEAQAVALEEGFEIRVAEAIVNVLDEVAALETRDERVAMLRYLIQTL